MERRRLEKEAEVLAAMAAAMDGRKKLSSSELNRDQVAVFVIDMLKGFAEEGPLSDKRVGALAEPIDRFLKQVPRASAVFLNDAHPEDAAEFGSYPAHCVKGTGEAEMVEVLKPHAEKGTVLEKNSTNGFVSGAFQEWFARNRDRFSTYVLTGDCTDICIKQFALTLKAWFMERNRNIRVLVPMDLVDTFHVEGVHDADLMHLVALWEMEQGGVEIVKGIA